jgi:hypothetical protein
MEGCARYLPRHYLPEARPSSQKKALPRLTTRTFMETSPLER